jgi:hypothetical protein
MRGSAGRMFLRGCFRDSGHEPSGQTTEKPCKIDLPSGVIVTIERTSISAASCDKFPPISRLESNRVKSATTVGVSYTVVAAA